MKPSSRFDFSTVARTVKSLALLAALLFATSAMAQSPSGGGFQTLGGGNAKIGGFGGPSVKLGTLNGNFAMLFGGYGGVYLGEAFMIGGGGYSLVSDYAVPGEIFATPLTGNFNLNMSYGGPMVEVTLLGDEAIHFGFNTMVGFGNASINSTSGSGNISTGRIMLVEPTLFVEANVTNWFRVSVGGGYRLVTSSRLAQYSASQLSGTNLDVSLKFGRF